MLMIYQLLLVFLLFFFNRNTTRNTGEVWPVKFHVLTSEHFKFDPDKYQVYIVMGNKEMGGWNKKDRLMKVER